MQYLLLEHSYILNRCLYNCVFSFPVSNIMYITSSCCSLHLMAGTLLLCHPQNNNLMVIERLVDAMGRAVDACDDGHLLRGLFDNGDSKFTLDRIFLGCCRLFSEINKSTPKNHWVISERFGNFYSDLLITRKIIDIDKLEKSTVTCYIDNSTGSKLPTALFQGPLIKWKTQHVCIKLYSDDKVVEKLRYVFKLSDVDSK